MQLRYRTTTYQKSQPARKSCHTFFSGAEPRMEALNQQSKFLGISFAYGLKWKFIVAVVLVILGIFILATGLTVHFVLQDQLKKSVEDFLVVSSKDDSDYDEWEDNTGKDAVPLYIKYNFFNITNLDEIQNDPEAKPNFDVVGPYVYRKFKKKVNVTFTEGGDKVSLSWWTYYVFQPQLSRDVAEDRITSINQAYLGIMALTKSESGLVSALTAPTTETLILLLTSYFPDLVVDLTFSQLAPYNQALLINEISETRNITTEEATDLFYSEWANSTTVPEETLWQVVGILSGTESSGISETSVRLLWEPNNGLPNLVNTSADTALLWNSADAGSAYQQDIIKNIFSLSDEELAFITSWRIQFNSRVTLPYLLATFNVTSAADLGWLQWGTGAVTSYVSVKDLAPDFGLTGIPEFGIWAKDIANSSYSLNVTASKKLLEGNLSLTTTEGLIAFQTAVMSSDLTSLQTHWGINTIQEGGLILQYMGYIGSTFVSTIITEAFQSGGGLFTTRTPQEWLWGVVDPLLNILLPEQSKVTFYYNQSSVNQAEKEAVLSTFWTGQRDLDKIFQYINWHGYPVLPAGAFWKDPVIVKGTNGHQFQPFLDDDDLLYVWVEELLRPIDLDYDEDVTKKDILLKRFRLALDNFAPDEKYFQTFTGFANMTLRFQGVPVYMSKPNWLDCAEEWQSYVTGVTPNEAKDDTFLDVEPYTGYVMDVKKSLQISMYIANETSPFDLWNKNIPKGFFYPVFYGDEIAEITDTLADDFKNTVYRVVLIRIVIFWIGVAGGSFLIICGLFLLGFVLWRNRRAKSLGYTVIMEDTGEYRE